MMAALSRLDLRVPVWGADELVERRCPICGSQGAPGYLRPDKLPVLQCPQCGVWYVSPVP